MKTLLLVGRLVCLVLLSAAIAACGGSAASGQPSNAPSSRLSTAAPTSSASEPGPGPSVSVTPPPVVLLASGSAGLDLDGLPAFAATHSTATCQSGPDVLTADIVTATELGELSGATVRGTVHPPASAADPGSIEIFIDAGDLADGSFQPFWTGPATFFMDADGVSGAAAFANLKLETDPMLPSPDPKWPASMAGRLKWRCDPWNAPNATPPTNGDVTPPPPSQTPNG